MIAHNAEAKRRAEGASGGGVKPRNALERLVMWQALQRRQRLIDAEDLPFGILLLTRSFF